MHSALLAEVRPVAPSKPPSARQRDRRRPFRTSITHGAYRLPAPVLDLLQTRLEADRRRNSAFALALFLSRMWSAPRRLVMAFPIDRRALAGHAGLDGMTEGKIRGAIATLERCGFLVREVVAPGRRYQRTADGLQRRPILFRFGPDFTPAFRAANGITRGPARPRRPLATAPAHRPAPVSMPVLRAYGGNGPLISNLRFPPDLGRSAPRPSAPTPPTVPIVPDARLEAAIQRLRAARNPSHATTGSR